MTQRNSQRASPADIFHLCPYSQIFLATPLPGLDTDITTTVQHCHICQLNKPMSPKALENGHHALGLEYI